MTGERVHISMTGDLHRRILQSIAPDVDYGYGAVGCGWVVGTN